MYIRKATENDIPRQNVIFTKARAFMAEQGNPDQWGPDGWPPESVILDDVLNGKSYVAVDDDGTVCGTFYFDFGNEPEQAYKDLNGGNWISGAPYGVVHRIAADPPGKGTGEFCLRWAIAQSNGHLKIDTHPANRPMRTLLTKTGFSERGTVMIGGTKKRIAFEFGGELTAKVAAGVQERDETDESRGD